MYNTRTPQRSPVYRTPQVNVSSPVSPTSPLSHSLPLVSHYTTPTRKAATSALNALHDKINQMENERQWLQDQLEAHKKVFHFSLELY